ncbi:LysR substrate-binding domain-containing protein [Kiloniella laminariae]|uniref:LysR substrate-binding domain-containing protein n=2 Tax=Kiloniella laminariae TaxID=454162 RepID=A0ABT4LPJ8_9PROT|nr:LysR substrate-binding domain-containing protein [Kiloniella laminariae]
MRRRLPPFAAVKAFEAAARHCNFQLASDELGISASAVSHQVKSLEEFIAMPLFIRRNNRLILREEGQLYYDRLCVALDEIERATETISKTGGKSQLTINLYPSLADMWLIPRLSGFHARNPDINVRLNTSVIVGSNLDREVDFALVYQSLDSVEDQNTILFIEEIIPVATPEYLNDHPAIEKAEDLLGHTLIASLSEDEEWKTWFEAQGITSHSQAQYLELDMSSTAVIAAKEKLGITMGRNPYLDDDLKAGRLIAPVSGLVSTGFCISLICTTRGKNLPYGYRFQDWLIQSSSDSKKS